MPGGAGITPTQTWTSFDAGSLRPTEQPYDVAISGSRGYFQVQTPDGREFLTRNGNFKPDVNGILRDPRGNALMGQGGTITIPVDVANVTIDGQGIITITDGNGASVNQQIVDQIRIVAGVGTDTDPLQSPNGPANWRIVDGQYFDPGNAELEDVAVPDVRQGFLENSNGDPLADLVQMISIQRRYDGASEVLNTQLNSRTNFSDLLRGGS